MAAEDPQRGRCLRWGALPLFLALSFLAAWPVAAHTRSQSYSQWEVEGQQVDVRFKIPAREVTRMQIRRSDSLEDLLVTYLITKISVRRGEEACEPIELPRILRSDPGELRVAMTFSCTESGSGAAIELRNEAFFELVPSHLHFARVRLMDGEIQEQLFTKDRRTIRVGSAAADPAAVDQASSRASTFFTYLDLGIEHILAGVDHIAFLLCLLLLASRARDVVLIVTGFTLGHSLTLSLAVLGWVQPNVGLIEALIGFTIALVAAENIGARDGVSREVAWASGVGFAALLLLGIWGVQGPPLSTLLGLGVFSVCYLHFSVTPVLAMRARPLITTLFGLIHGFGFANVLIEVELPVRRLAVALFGFNLGVEVGQLGIVLLLTGVGIAGSKLLAESGRRLAIDLLSAGLCGMGMYWFVGRAYF